MHLDPAVKTSCKPLQVPGKVFLLGEYNVLSGKTGIIGTIAPCFGLGGSAPLVTVAEQSPAGRYLSSVHRPLQICFDDPYLGKGGLGGSTAEYLAAFCETNQDEQGECDLIQNVWRIWSAYQTLHETDRVPPSGVDLIAQCFGGVIRVATRNRQLTQWLGVASAAPVLESILVWKADNRKVKTHEHLAQMESLDFILALSQELEPRVLRGMRALQAGDAGAFATELTDYAKCLASHNLEHEESAEDREIAMSASGVLGAKGMGALLADGLVMQVDPKLSLQKRRNLIQKLEQELLGPRGLSLIGDGNWFASRLGPE